MDELTQRFLGAYNAIDKHLRGLCEAEVHVSFLQLIRDGAKKSPAVRSFAEDLKEYGQLRNAIVHDFRDEAIAVPCPHVVERMEAIREVLLAPPRVEQFASKPVVRCQAGEAIGATAGVMLQQGLSQVPVYREGRFVGLLTSDTITRWVACCLAAGEPIAGSEPVEVVLRHGEGEDHCVLLGRRATVFDALAEFDRAIHRGIRLDAILLTERGRATEAPLGILTAHDIPRLHAAATGQRT